MITEKQFEDFIQKLKKAIDEIADKTDIWDSERWNKFRRLLRNEINNLSKEVYHSPQIKPDEMQSSESEQDTCRNADDGLSAGQNKTEDKPKDMTQMEDSVSATFGTSNSKGCGRICLKVLNKRGHYEDVWCGDKLYGEIQLCPKCQKKEKER